MKKSSLPYSSRWKNLTALVTPAQFAELVTIKNRYGVSPSHHGTEYARRIARVGVGRYHDLQLDLERVWQRYLADQ